MAKIIHGDALTRLKELQSESIDCCITSPPYYNLRDYKITGQIGLENTKEEYINKLVEIFQEVKRVLVTTGSCWCVLGDTYDGNKSLMMIPERFGIAMVDHGWILRNVIIWKKNNCMPSSAKDRFTNQSEFVYFFVKNQKYFFETQYEPLDKNSDVTYRQQLRRDKSYDSKEPYMNNFPKSFNPLGRIKRNVWTVNTRPFSGAHFAVFPPDLVLPMIKAGCPEYICNKCNTPRKLEYEETEMEYENKKFGGNKASGYENRTYSGNEYKRIVRTDNGMSDCGCNTDFHSGVVLDPFFGAGTVGLVALQNGRDFVGIELNKDYIQIANKRLDPLLNQQKLR